MPIITREILKEPKHTKAIINGKMYDTEKAEKLFGFEGDRILFITPKGNYFSCKHEVIAGIEYKNGRLVQTTQVVCFDIQEESKDRLKELFGRYDIEAYIKLFGEPEEA